MQAQDIAKAVIGSRIAEEMLLELATAGQALDRHSGLNHEAVGVGVGAGVGADDVVQTSYRSGAPVMHARGGLSVTGLIHQGLGLLPGPREQHPGGPPTLRSTGILGGQLPMATGIALAFARRGEQKIVVSVIGDGASNEGAVHETFNVAAVKKAPIVFVIENNEIALSRPFAESTAAPDLASRGAGYGMPAVQVDGADAFAVRDAVREARDRALRGDGPTLIEALITRPASHASSLHDGRDESEIAQTFDKDAKKVTTRTAVELGADAAWLAQEEEKLNAEAQAALREGQALVAKRKTEASKLTRMSDAEAWNLSHATPAPAWMED